MDLLGAAARLLFGPAGIVVGFFLALYASRALSDQVDAWLGRVTGWSAWAARVHLVERQLSHPALWKATSFALSSAVGLTAIGTLMILHPQDPWARSDAVVVMVVAMALWLVAGTVGSRWWRVSGSR